MRDDSALRSAPSAPELPPGPARADVVSLWHERARRLGLSERQQPDLGALAGRALHELTGEYQALVAHAVPVMELLHQQILNTHSMVLLTDRRGLIMHALGDADFLERAERVALAPGVLWSEDSKGTNAIGTALAEERATLVHGSEHFLTVNRFLTCSCCPIRGPRGELVGALDVSGPHQGYHPHTMGLVRLSAQLIEQQLFRGAFGHALRIHLHPRAERLGTLLEGVAAFDDDGRLLAANPNACELLGVRPGAHAGYMLSSLFDLDGPALLHARGAHEGPRPLRLRSGEVVWARLEPGVAAAPQRGTTVPRVPPAAPPPRVRSPHFADLDSGDAAVAAVLEKLRAVRGHDIPVLILGETGTGKEWLARAVHNESTRRDGPFVAVDCACLPESLIEAELFGYEEGAFTGARRRGSPGKILLADGGTLFLDEIGEMPLALQTRLLRVLQERAVLPLGASRERPVDIALVCATHRNLPDMMRRELFRADLYYRVNGLTVRLPPLRERSDLPTLIERILGAPSGPIPALSPQVSRALSRCLWPGNIRQLASVLRTARALAGDSGLIRPEHLPEEFFASAAGEDVRVEPPGAADLHALRADAVCAALQRNGGNVSAAARELRVSRNTIYRAVRAARST